MKTRTVMKRTLMALCVASALGAVSQANAVPGVKFDQTGTSGAGVIVDNFAWFPDNALLFKGVAAPGDAAATLMAVGRLDSASGFGGSVVPVAGSFFTYELLIPVTVLETVIGGGAGNLKLTFDLARAGTEFFNIYHTDTAPNQGAGTGYGGASGCGGSCTLILSGDPNFVGSFMNLGYALDGFDNYNYLKDGDPIGTTIASKQFSGSKTISIELDTQDSAYFRTDLETISFDLQLLTQGFGAPFPASATPVVAAKVMGESPDVGGSVAGTEINDVNDGSLIVTGSFTINDEECNGGGGHDGSKLTNDCDVRLATGAGSLKVFAQTTPEPGTVALMGLGLGAIGWAGLRRRRQKS